MQKRFQKPLALFAMALSFAEVLVCASQSHADIFMRRRADGTIYFTNVPGRRGRNSSLAMRTPTPPTPRPGTSSQYITASADPLPSGSAQIRSLYLATARDQGRYTRFDAYIHEAATLYQLPEALIRAVIKQESDFNPYSVSSSGAAGLMQLMPSTAQSMMVRDVFDPRQSILGGTRFLRILANMFNGDLVLTIAAYNAGPNAVIRYSGVPPYDETQGYVRQVLRYYYLYRGGAVPGQAVPTVAPTQTQGSTPTVPTTAVPPGGSQPSVAPSAQTTTNNP